MWRPRLVTAPWRRGGIPVPSTSVALGAVCSAPGSLLTGWGGEARRGIVGPSGPTHALAASVSGYPDGSMSLQLLERCMEAAIARGVDVTAPYKPWLPVDLMQTLLVDIHDTVGCSWLMAIVLACLSIRVATLPMTIAAARGAREKALIQPQFTQLTEKQKTLTMEGDQSKAQEVSKQLQAFTQKHGKFFMLKGTSNLILFQMPLYITAFAAMRGFAGHPDLYRGFAMEAPLWLDSLALADPYALLPLLTASIMLTNTELFGSIDSEAAAVSPVAETTPAPGAAGGQATMQKYQKWFMRGSTVIFIPMTWNFPAGVFIFMSTNMLASVVQNRLLRLPRLERLLEMPPRPESVAAAAATASAAGSPALVPLAKMLRPTTPPLNTEVRRLEHTSPPGAQKPGVALIAAPVTRAPGASPDKRPGASATLPPSNPRFAVRRSRPAGPAQLSAGTS